ncbi:hypothetical protein GCM10023149_02500 [Mucilaginibacter gynuensis]|uniref:Response regulator receiver domain-containing protein n=1 Tax=Mucilaginibacter gynuensis TaxID=1302236 RepID=A0ABP8FPV2_9SPHI
MPVLIIHQTDKDVLDVLNLIFKIEGFEVHPFNGYPVGLASYIHYVKADLVVLDYYMNGTECKSLLNEIRAAGEDLPVIVAGCSSSIQKFSTDYGFTDYIEMPFEVAYFYEKVVSCLAHKALHH